MHFWLLAVACCWLGLGTAVAQPITDPAPTTWGVETPQEQQTGQADLVPNSPEAPAQEDSAVAAAPSTHTVATPPAGGLSPELPATESALGDAPVRYILEGIEIRGNRRTRPRVVLRYVPFEIGDVFDVEDPEVELTRYRLLITGFFRDVQFSLRRGTRRGQVILIIDVVERNTVVVNDLWMGVSSDRDPRGVKRPLTAYGGVDVAETNLAGSGITLGSAMGVAQNQLALRVRFLDPAFTSTNWMLSAELLFNDAQDFFGNSKVEYQAPRQDRVQSYVVLPYERFGGSAGVGHDLSVATQLWLQYRIEGIHAQVPEAASHERGGIQPREPIRFHIQPGDSVLSALRASLQFDTRDHPFLPARGWLTRAHGELGLVVAGSDYSYQRLELSASHWWSLPWRHVVRLELFGGALVGDAPFFEHYYVGDFSDFLASRVLGLNFDRRPSANFLGTAVAEVRRGNYVAKVGGEYRVPLYRGKNSVYGIDFFASGGAFAIASQHDLEDPPIRYSGLASVPLDLTGNLGFRLDTSGGGLTFAFSNVFGFVPAR